MLIKNPRGKTSRELSQGASTIAVSSSEQSQSGKLKFLLIHVAY